MTYVTSHQDIPAHVAPRRVWEYRGHHLITEWDGYNGGYHVLYFPDHAADLKWEEVARCHATPELADRSAQARVDAGNVHRPPVPPDVMTPSRRTYGTTYLVLSKWDARTVSPTATPYHTGHGSGLEVERDPDGTWWTHTLRWPESRLTQGHASNHEAHWAVYALADLAPWDVLVDVRAAVEGEPEACIAARRELARKVDQVDERFTKWRMPTPAPEPLRAIPCDVPGLTVVTYGRGDWAVRTNDFRVHWTTSRTAALEAVRRLGELANWTLPPYVLGLDQVLRWQLAALDAELSDHGTVAENFRARAEAARRERVTL